MVAKDYLALLRGINVGGRNIIRMADLVVSFEQMGFSNIKTYIQSGNVIFSTDEPEKSLEPKIEKALSTDFDYQSTVVVISADGLERIVKEAPKGFGSEPDKFKYDFIFLKKTLDAKEAIKQIKVREGVDTATVGTGVLYFSRQVSQLTKSHLSKIVASPIYKQITIRNWNTTYKLLGLLSER